MPIIKIKPAWKYSFINIVQIKKAKNNKIVKGGNKTLNIGFINFLILLSGLSKSIKHENLTFSKYGSNWCIQ